APAPRLALPGAAPLPGGGRGGVRREAAGAVAGGGAQARRAGARRGAAGGVRLRARLLAELRGGPPASARRRPRRSEPGRVVDVSLAGVGAAARLDVRPRAGRRRRGGEPRLASPVPHQLVFRRADLGAGHRAADPHRGRGRAARQPGDTRLSRGVLRSVVVCAGLSDLADHDHRRGAARHAAGGQRRRGARSGDPALRHRGRQDDTPGGRSAAAGDVPAEWGGLRARGRTRAALDDRGARPGRHDRGGAGGPASDGRAVRFRGSRCRGGGATVSAPAPEPPARLIALDAGDRPAPLDPVEAARRLTAALATEPGAVLLRPSPVAAEIASQLPPDVPLAALLPDLPQLMREIGDRGAVAAALGRLRRGGLAGSAALVVAVLRHLPAVARQAFRGIVPVLLALDRAALGAGALRSIVLSAPLTDLLLAAGHRACLAHVVRFVRRRLGAQAALETLNLGHLLPRLDAWGVAPD